MARLEQRNILIVGARTGIGAEIVRLAQAEGARIWALGRKKPQANGISWSIWDALGDDEVPVGHLPEELHGLVYCPGSITLKPFNRLTDSDYLQEWKLNFLGATRVTRAVYGRLKNTGDSSVVYVSTVAAQTGIPFHSSIASAKAALEGLTRSLAAESAVSGIRVNALAPSLTDTPLAAALLNSDEKRIASGKRHPLGRVGTPQDMASAAIFLLSPESGWVTGQILGVDGGLGSIRGI
ncbi:MAG: SDR family oxidoreductase [Sphingomonadales bacterium]|nr:SDR family oxidoreductase [Sphingomonadales bacterium]